MIRMFVRHQVDDYAAWRKVYDEFGPVQKSGGVIAESVYRSVEDPNDVTVTHDFPGINEAQSFANSAELKETMQAAGVAGQPQIWFTEES